MIQKDLNLLGQSKKFWCHQCQLQFTSHLQPGIDQILCPRCENDFCQIFSIKTKPNDFSPYQKPLKQKRYRIPRMTTQAVLLALSQYAQDANAEKYREITEDDIKKLKTKINHIIQQCLICKQQFSIGMQALKCPCGHIYHVQCLSEWMEYKNTCPKCRVKILSSE